MSDPLWIQKLVMLPADARGRIRRYIEEGHGASLSTFYRAILSNDLIGAIQGGDAENRAALADYVDYLTGYAPADCYGSLDNLYGWHGIGRAEGAEEEIAIYKVQMETAPGADDWFNANVTGSAAEARSDAETRAASTGDIQRVRITKDDEVIAISRGRTLVVHPDHQ